MQTIIGAGGSIGKALAPELFRYTTNVRLVSRNPSPVTGKEETVAADITDTAAARAAIAGSEVVYLVAGLPYKLKTWQQQWPVIMRNVIDACRHACARLVFFDNMYMYAAEGLHNITEEQAINPPSKKGIVRAQIADMLLQATRQGSLKAMIARSSDFYGPAVGNSILNETVYKNMKKGKKGMWMVDAGKTHSFTYVPDAAKATALLGNTADAWNQVWHLPTASGKLNGKQWVELFAAALQQPARYTVLSRPMLKMLGLFIPVLKESYEMMYQYDRDYFFNSEKFMKRFPDFPVTAYEAGVRATIHVDD